MTREVAVRKLQKQKAECLEELVDFSGVAEAYDMAIEALKQPEIIRCKDCKFFVSDMEWCEADDEHRAEPDAFCSWAERREDED